MEQLIFNIGQDEVYYSYSSSDPDMSARQDSLYLYLVNSSNLPRYLDFIHRAQPHAPEILHIDKIDYNNGVQISSAPLLLGAQDPSHRNRTNIHPPHLTAQEITRVGVPGNKKFVVQISTRKYIYTVKNWFARYRTFPAEQKLPFNLLTTLFKLELQGIKFESFSFDEVLVDHTNNNYVFTAFHATSFNLMENFSNHHYAQDTRLILPVVWGYMALAWMEIPNMKQLLYEELRGSFNKLREDKRQLWYIMDSMLKNYDKYQTEFNNRSSTIAPDLNANHVKCLAYILFLYSRAYSNYNEVMLQKVREQYSQLLDTRQAVNSTEKQNELLSLLETFEPKQNYTNVLENRDVTEYLYRTSTPFILAMLMYIQMMTITPEYGTVSGLIKRYLYKDSAVIPVERWVNYFDVMKKLNFVMIKEYMLYISVRMTIPNSCLGPMVYVDQDNSVDNNILLPFDMNKNRTDYRPVDYAPRYKRDYEIYLKNIKDAYLNLTNANGIITILNDGQTANISTMLATFSNRGVMKFKADKDIRKIKIEDVQRVLEN